MPRAIFHALPRIVFGFPRIGPAFGIAIEVRFDGTTRRPRKLFQSKYFTVTNFKHRWYLSNNRQVIAMDDFIVGALPEYLRNTIGAATADPTDLVRTVVG